jgi:hypothetical protein
MQLKAEKKQWQLQSKTNVLFIQTSEPHGKSKYKNKNKDKNKEIFILLSLN